MDHEMDFPAIATTREFVVKSKGVGAYVEVRETDLISDVRRLLRDDLDDDQLPSPDFAFHINGVRISKKQEGRKLAFDILDQNASVELIARSDDTKEEACAKSDDAFATPSKRRRKRKNRGTTEPLADANTNENENENDNSSPRTSHDRYLDQRNEDEVMMVYNQHKLLPAPKHSTGWDGRQWKLNAKQAYQKYKCKGAPGEKCGMRTRTYCACNPSWWMCQACHLRHCLLFLRNELLPDTDGNSMS